MSDKLNVLGVNLSDDNSDDLAPTDPLDVETFLANNIGEGKQFADEKEALRALAKGKLHADTFIETLKLEVKGEREEKERVARELAEAKKIDDLLAAINAGGDSEEPPAALTDPAKVDLDQVKTIVRDLLEAEKAAAGQADQLKKIQANQDKAFELLSKPVEEGGFGSLANAKAAIRKYVGEDSNKADILNRMGSFTPETVAEFLKLQLKDSESGVIPGVGETALNVAESFSAAQKPPMTWSQVQKIRKENPKLYRDPKFQTKVHQIAAQFPDTFWDNKTK